MKSSEKESVILNKSKTTDDDIQKKKLVKKLNRYFI